MAIVETVDSHHDGDGHHVAGLHRHQPACLVTLRVTSRTYDRPIYGHIGSGTPAQKPEKQQYALVSPGRRQGAHSALEEQRAGHEPSQRPMRQLIPAGQTLPQRPQFIESLAKSDRQTPLQNTPLQTHIPPAQVSPDAQAFPQRPQWFVSTAGLIHTLSPDEFRHQYRVGVLPPVSSQMHRPEEQDGSRKSTVAGHTLPHVPQFMRSF